MMSRKKRVSDTSRTSDYSPINDEYSLIMTLYAGDVVAYFWKAIDSILSQTILPAELVLVCDGPISKPLELACKKLQQTAPILVRMVRLKENVGHGMACNAGVKACRSELVAKLDADDIALPDRFEKQLQAFRDDPELAVCSGHVAEFEHDTTQVTAYRKVPLTHKDILHYIRRRSPFNHPAIMYRRSAVLAVGGYPAVRRAEDYCLWVQLLAAGYRSINLDRVLVYFRASADSYARKRSWANIKYGMWSRWYSYKHGMSNLWDVFVVFVGHCLLLLMPRETIRRFYKAVLR